MGCSIHRSVGLLFSVDLNWGLSIPDAHIALRPSCKRQTALKANRARGVLEGLDFVFRHYERARRMQFKPPVSVLIPA